MHFRVLLINYGNVKNKILYVLRKQIHKIISGVLYFKLTEKRPIMLPKQSSFYAFENYILNSKMHRVLEI